MVRTFVLVTGVAILVGCAGPELPREINTFRFRLADPKRYPVRTGLTIDEEALKSASDSFMRENREVLLAGADHSCTV